MPDDDFEIEADLLNHAAEMAKQAVAAERAMVLVVYDQGFLRGSMGANGYRGETEKDALAVMAWDLLLTLKALLPLDNKITLTNSIGETWTLEDDPKLLKKMVLN